MQHHAIAVLVIEVLALHMEGGEIGLRTRGLCLCHKRQEHQ